MCGRFTITLIHGFFSRFAIENQDIELISRYNIAPTQMVPIVVGQSPNRIEMMRWGLIPFWAKDPKIGNRLINARAESISTKPAFRTSLKRKRCLVPATGFYEWKRVGRDKLPHYVRRKDGALFAFAGLYDRWRERTAGEDIPTFTIITTTPNTLLGRIHNRMPVMLKEEDEPLWLRREPLEEGDLKRVFRPYPSGLMEAYPVSTAVNNPKNDTANLIERF